MANRSINKVILLGRLGRDAETAYTGNQTAVTKFSVATNHRWKDTNSGEWKEDTNWSNVVLWRSEKLGQYLTKGKQVYVEGRLVTRSYENKEGKKVYATEVIADEVILLGGDAGAQDSEPAPMRSAPRSGPRPVSPPMEIPVGDDDVPF